MINIHEVKSDLLTYWGEDGQNVIDACAKETPFNDSFDAFLTHCYACGGNWGGMLLTGIKELFPKVWDAIPDDMGLQTWLCLCDTLALLGVELEEKA